MQQKKHKNRKTEYKGRQERKEQETDESKSEKRNKLPNIRAGRRPSPEGTSLTALSVRSVLYTADRPTEGRQTKKKKGETEETVAPTGSDLGGTPRVV